VFILNDQEWEKNHQIPESGQLNTGIPCFPLKVYSL